MSKVLSVSSVKKWLKSFAAANITKFQTSQAARKAVKELGKHSDFEEKTVVTQSSYTWVGDFLFTFTDNANGPGASAAMPMNEYQKMQKDGDDYASNVIDHETAHVYGPPIIV